MKRNHHHFFSFLNTFSNCHILSAHSSVTSFFECFCFRSCSPAIFVSVCFSQFLRSRGQMPPWQPWQQYFGKSLSICCSKKSCLLHGEWVNGWARELGCVVQWLSKLQCVIRLGVHAHLFIQTLYGFVSSEHRCVFVNCLYFMLCSRVSKSSTKNSKY